MNHYLLNAFSMTHNRLLKLNIVRNNLMHIAKNVIVLLSRVSCSYCVNFLHVFSKLCYLVYFVTLHVKM